MFPKHTHRVALRTAMQTSGCKPELGIRLSPFTFRAVPVLVSRPWTKDQLSLESFHLREQRRVLCGTCLRIKWDKPPPSAPVSLSVG